MVNGTTPVSKTDANLNFILPASIWFGSVAVELKNICQFQKDLASFAVDSVPSGTSQCLWQSRESSLGHSFHLPGVASTGGSVDSWGQEITGQIGDVPNISDKAGCVWGCVMYQDRFHACVA